MGNMVGDQNGGAGKLRGFGCAPDLQTNERREGEAGCDPVETITPVAHRKATKVSGVIESRLWLQPARRAEDLAQNDRLSHTVAGAEQRDE